MFEIGFSEILLVCIVGLLVLGPERLPGAARTAALWIGRLRRHVNQIRSDVEREIGADEIRAQLHNESILQELRDTRRDIEASARALDPTRAADRAPDSAASTDKQDRGA